MAKTTKHSDITTDDLLLSRTGQFSRLVAQLIEQRLAVIGITYQEMRVAGLLMGETNMTQKELAAKLLVRPATLSVALSRLERAGLVKRVQSRTDKRVNYLKLVPSKKITDVNALLKDVENTITKGISKTDLAKTRKVMGQLIQNLKLANEQEHLV